MRFVALSAPLVLNSRRVRHARALRHDLHYDDGSLGLEACTLLGVALGGSRRLLRMS